MSDHYEHSVTLRDAQQELISLRRKVRHLHWISGGVGYDNMGARELDQVRLKLDEADHWLAAAAGPLRAGAKRAAKQGYGPDPLPTFDEIQGILKRGSGD